MAGLSFEPDILSDEAQSDEEKKLKIDDLEFLAEDFKSIDQVLRERYLLMQLDLDELEDLCDGDPFTPTSRIDNSAV